MIINYSVFVYMIVVKSMFSFHFNLTVNTVLLKCNPILIYNYIFCTFEAEIHF